MIPTFKGGFLFMVLHQPWQQWACDPKKLSAPCLISLLRHKKNKKSIKLAVYKMPLSTFSNKINACHPSNIIFLVIWRNWFVNLWLAAEEDLKICGLLFCRTTAVCHCLSCPLCVGKSGSLPMSLVINSKMVYMSCLHSQTCEQVSSMPAVRVHCTQNSRHQLQLWQQHLMFKCLRMASTAEER